MENFLANFRFVIDLIGPGISLIIAFFVYKQAQRVHSKDFKIAEKVKSQMLNFTSVAKTFVTKSGFDVSESRCIHAESYAQLKSAVASLVYSPTYHLFLSFLSDEKERKNFEIKMMVLLVELEKDRLNPGFVSKSLGDLLTIILNHQDEIMRIGNFTYKEMVINIFANQAISINDTIEPRKQNDDRRDLFIHGFFYLSSQGQRDPGRQCEVVPGRVCRGSARPFRSG